MDIKEQEILGDQIDSHWYYASKVKALRASVRGVKTDRVLDVGAGSGFFSRYLLRHDLAREAVCVDTGYEQDRVETVAGKKMSFARSCDHMEADLVLLMDVLEHVDDDVALLRDYAQKVPDGCRFLITVPAFNWLWSEHDEFLEHRRRYTSGRLVDTIEAAGLRPVASYYYFGAVLPIAAGVRLLDNLRSASGREAKSGLKRHSPLVNTVLKTLCAMELPFLRINHLGGLSVFALAEKR